MGSTEQENYWLIMPLSEDSDNLKLISDIFMTENPLVSICCITYNHQDFISKTIDGFLIQKTNFPVEIIIGDDHSTDRTKDLINSYVNKYPDRIFLITSKQNIGAVANERRVFLKARGKYIAVCEGDDYWTDPDKLQKQVDFLEMNSDYSVCFHRCKHFDIENNKLKDDRCGYLFISPDVNGVDVTTPMFLHNWITQPLTMVFHRNLFDPNLTYQYKFYRDNHLIYHLLQEGKGFLFSFEGGVYNLHNGGMHSKLDSHDNNELTINIARELFLFNSHNELLRLNLLRSIQYHIHWYLETYRANKRILGYVIEHFRYSRSVKQLLKNILNSALSIRKDFNKRVIIEPMGGLGNRMRVIASVLQLQKKQHFELICIWNEKSELNAPFTELFEEISGMTIETKKLRYKWLRSSIQKNTFLRIFANVINKTLGIDFCIKQTDFNNNGDLLQAELLKQSKKNQSIYIQTCEGFINYNIVFQQFKLLGDLKSRVDATVTNFNKTIGIHIRRTDNSIAIENSPIELFKDKIKQEISEDPEATFFLATDDPDVESEMNIQFGRKIIINRKNFNRNSLSGIQDAVIDMYCLAKTTKIYGSFWSSFSIVSSMIGNIQIISLTKEDINHRL